MNPHLKRNFVLLLATISLVILLALLPGYSNVSLGLPDETRFIFLHWDNSAEHNYKLRFGTTFSFFNYINQITPPEAVILMPPDSVLLDKKTGINFLPQITEKQWASYFVYPRMLVYEKEKDKSPMYSYATHVAIVNGWGIDKLHYKTQGTVRLAVAPINH